MAVVIPNTKDKDTFPEHFIAVANPPQRPYSASEVTWINNSGSHYTQANTGESDNDTFSGDVPEYTHLAPTAKPSDTETKEIAGLENITDATLDSGWGKLEQVLNEELAKAANGFWKEQGSNNNPNSINLTQQLCRCRVGVDPWCACFVSWALIRAGLNSLKTASSQKYRNYGFEIGTSSWANVRKNDIIVLSYGGGKGHVGFFRGYDPNSRRVNILGGNQKNDLNIKSFSTSRITSVKRNWRVPTEFDQPLYVPRAPRGGSYEDTR